MRNTSSAGPEDLSTELTGSLAKFTSNIYFCFNKKRYLCHKIRS